jgi:transcriptional regulator with XRE-family HTH domain
LRRLREAASVTPLEAAAVLDVTDSTIYRIERGSTGIRPRDVTALLERYGVTDTDMVRNLSQLAKEGKQRGWWARYRGSITSQYANLVGIEAVADELRTYNAIVVPGLLQTQDYARALFREAAEPASLEQIEQRVELRMKRQERLSGDEPPRLSAVIDESVIRRRYGGTYVMREQLQHLIHVARTPNVSLRVVPFDSGTHSGAVTGFILPRVSDFPHKTAYVENLTGDIWHEGEGAERYYAIHNRLRAASLSADDSIRLIESVAAGLA